MGVSETIRKQVFWAVDAINGAQIQKHTKDIEAVLGGFNSEYSKKIKD